MSKLIAFVFLTIFLCLFSNCAKDNNSATAPNRSDTIYINTNDPHIILTIVDSFSFHSDTTKYLSLRLLNSPYLIRDPNTFNPSFVNSLQLHYGSTTKINLLCGDSISLRSNDSLTSINLDTVYFKDAILILK